MAYLNILASVSEERIQAYRRSRRAPLNASRGSHCSHLIAYWVEVQPLGQHLGEAIDGGEPLHERLWHPFRPPVAHHPDAVRRLNERLHTEWQRLGESLPIPDNDWYVMEIRRVLEIFDHASSRGECIVSFLDRPHDFARAWRVRLPDLTGGSWLRRWLGL